MKSIYESVIAVDDIVGLAVGTRPDCLLTDIYDYLTDINKRTYFSLELGLQSASDEVLKDRLTNLERIRAWRCLEAVAAHRINGANKAPIQPNLHGTDNI